VSPEEKQRRADEIMAMQYDISYENNMKLLNTTQKVLIDRLEGENFIGRTQFDSPEVDNEVIIQANLGYLRIGDFVNAKIIEAEAFDLIGQPIL
jgi:ribosomal protein S12 methylthiotransferase